MRFARHIRQPFEKYIKPRFAGLPIRYLEVGVFEPECLIWMFANILTNPDSIADVVGIKGNSHELLGAGPNDRCIIHNMSYKDCTSISGSSYDMIFIDGSSDYDTVLQAAQHLHRLVVPRGLMVFDDCHLTRIAKAVRQFTEISGKECTYSTCYETRCQRCLQIW